MRRTGAEWTEDLVQLVKPAGERRLIERAGGMVSAGTAAGLALGLAWLAICRQPRRQPPPEQRSEDDGDDDEGGYAVPVHAVARPRRHAFAFARAAAATRGRASPSHRSKGDHACEMNLVTR